MVKKPASFVFLFISIFIIFFPLCASAQSLPPFTLSPPDQPTSLPSKQDPKPVLEPPGWLGFGVIPEPQGTAHDSIAPFDPKAKAAIYCDLASSCKGWRKIAPGTLFQGIGEEMTAPIDLKLRGVFNKKYPDTEYRKWVVLFEGEHSFREKPVWIFPKTSRIAVKAVRIDDGMRALGTPGKVLYWKIGEFKVGLEKSSPTQAEWQIWRDEKKIFQKEFKKESGPKTQPSEREIQLEYAKVVTEGIPYPVSAFQFGSGQTLTIAQMLIPGGNGFIFFLLEKNSVKMVGPQFVFYEK